MSKIKELPELERPREKLIRFGADKLSNEELLAIIIATGYKGKNAKDIAYEILSSTNGLLGLTSLSYKSLLSFKGISKVKALTLSSIFELYKRISPQNKNKNCQMNEEYLINKYVSHFRNISQEEVVVICINSKKEIIHEEIMFKGTSNSVNGSIKEIIRILLDYNSRSFYLIHNHPSGEALPSIDDILLTKNLVFKAKQIGIKMINHLIIGSNDYYSFEK